MKIVHKVALAFVFCFVANFTLAQTSKYKCMIQMTAYQGEKAYVIVSLVNPKGEYEKTLAVLGPDKQWFNTLKEWYKFQTKTREKINTVTGASVGGGDRAVRTLEIDDSKLNKGYKLRFESAVEEQKYHVKDVELAVTPEGLVKRTEGSGYIRFVKLSKVQ